jgi:type III restriction enzyme
MKIQFEANQEYQLEAIKSVVDIFEGQQSGGNDLQLEITPPTGQLKMANELLIGNLLTLDQKTIFKNLQKIQKDFNTKYITVNPETKEEYGGIELSKELGSMDFSLEMETGTGKTYVYLRTIHELSIKYGFKKFVIVVPSIAIKEGVIKNLQITKDHFDLLYNNPKMDFHVYDPKKRGQLKRFGTTNSLQILVMNIDAFAISKDKRDKRVIYQDSDLGRPIDYLTATNPFVIIDEPQNMESDIRKEAISDLNPLCTLRYSATHKNLYNLLYKLDPVRAYDLGLVKKIEVDSIMSEDAFSAAYIQLIKIDKKGKGKITAKVAIDESDERGLQKKELTIEPGDDLFELSGGREVYKNYILDGIKPAEKSIDFINGKTFYLGQKDAGLWEETVKYQIQKTVENHFEKEQKLKDKGIKVLSLFFIDKVSNYREYIEGGFDKGKFAQWFEEAYKSTQKKSKFKGVLKFKAAEVHNGYFAKDKTGNWKDSSERGGESAKTEADASAYELIMTEKEKLLDPNVPLRFIFSHSALREGWDNPNVFQICTINETTSEIKKRQEIGRGLRLPVNQNGERIMDSHINTLTVIANESYEDFAKNLQQEIETECGVNFTGRIKNKRDRQKIKLKKQFELDKNFKDIWNRIKQKTKYHVDYKTNELILRAAQNLQLKTINKPKLVSTRAGLNITSEGVTSEIRSVSANIITQDFSSLIIPNIISSIQSKTNLTKETIIEILKKSQKLESILVNPQQLIDECISSIRMILFELMIDGIKYEKISGNFYDMSLFEDKELEGYLNKLYKVQNQEKTLYDYIVYDSEVENKFAHDLESREDVKFFSKLPSWFKIPTPIGNYNPDWAIVFENDKRIYFIAETKKEGEIRGSESMKIECGRKHFDILDDVEFERVEKLSEIEI